MRTHGVTGHSVTHREESTNPLRLQVDFISGHFYAKQTQPLKPFAASANPATDSITETQKGEDAPNGVTSLDFTAVGLIRYAGVCFRMEELFRLFVFSASPTGLIS